MMTLKDEVALGVRILGTGTANTIGERFAFVLGLVLSEIQRARDKFPESACRHMAMCEEAGEVAQALMYEPWVSVVAECVQVAAASLRLAVEGDTTLEPFRLRNVHGGDYRLNMESGAVMPGTVPVVPQTIRGVDAETLEREFRQIREDVPLPMVRRH